MNPTSLPIRGALVEEFLGRRGWAVERRTGRLVDLAPPLASGLGELRFTLPASDSASDAQLVLRSVVTSLATLYEREEPELLAMLSAPSALMSVKLEDEDTAQGTVGLPRFEGLVETLRKTILDGTDSVRTDLPIVREHSDFALAFIERCRFLPTEMGSYVARIQLPEDHPLGETSLLATEPVLSASVGQRIIDVLSLAVNHVLIYSDEAYEDDFLMESAPLLNIQVLEDVGDLIRRGTKETMRVSVSNLDTTSEVRVTRGELLRLGRLDRYIDFLRERAELNIDLDVRGRIVRLHSRNPLQNRNYIAVEIPFEGQRVLLGMSLRSADYAVALAAHRANQEVRVVGIAERLKRQLSLRSLQLLEPV